MTDSKDLQNPTSASASTAETSAPAAPTTKKATAAKPKKTAAPARASKKAATESGEALRSPKPARSAKKSPATKTTAAPAPSAASTEDGQHAPAMRAPKAASQARTTKSASARTPAAKKPAPSAAAAPSAATDAAPAAELRRSPAPAQTSPQPRPRRTSAAKPKAAAGAVAPASPTDAAAPVEAMGTAEAAPAPAKRGRRGAKSAAGAKSSASAKEAAGAISELSVAVAPAAPSVEAPATEAAAEERPSQNAGKDRPAGRGSLSRGRRGGQRKQPETAVEADQQQAAAGSSVVDSAPVALDAAIFPSDEPLSSPAWDGGSEADEAAGDDGNEQRADGASGEKKKRSRSRRGRGRKKGASQEAGPQSEEQRLGDEGGAPEQDDEAPPPQPEKKDRSQGRGRKRKGVESGESDEDREAAASKLVRRKMFVSVVPEEQVEVVITEEGQVQEYYVEMMHQIKTKGNIYKGIIHNVDPNLQAAFVNYGAVKNGFLQIDEVHPEYYVAAHEGGRGKKYPPIQKVLKPGQEVLVQVVKEPAGTKGAFLTTYLSMPGRFLVLTPGREQIGVSRKVESESERARLRELLEGLNPGPGLGVIIRTVSMGTSKANLQSDLHYLKRSWSEVRTRGTTETAPCLVYQELDLATRAVRDYLNDAVSEVWIDDEKAAASTTEMASMLFPAKRNLVRVHKEAQPLFERFNLQRQIDQIQSREVALPSGGRLAIDPTEALTAIDINSGRSGGKNNFEDMAYRTNMEAARMIPLQLRLRDIGGQIVADFIEMRDKSHWREVEKALRDGMKTDRARYDVGKMGPFGMLEIVRQRLGSSAISISTESCPYCKGTGVRRNMEWQCQKALRDITRLMRAAEGQESAVVYEVEPALALYLLNSKRQRLFEMEQNFGVHLEVRPKAPEHI